MQYTNLLDRTLRLERFETSEPLSDILLVSESDIFLQTRLKITRTQLNFKLIHAQKRV